MDSLQNIKACRRKIKFISHPKEHKEFLKIIDGLYSNPKNQNIRKGAR